MTDAENTPAEPEVRWLQQQSFEDRLPELLSIDKRGAHDKWHETHFRKRLDFNKHHARMALINDKLVGYYIYEIHSNHYQILKLEIDPDYKNHGVAEKLVEDMLQKVNDPSHGQNMIVFPVHEEATELLTLISQKYGFHIDEKQREIKKHFRDGKSAYLMRHKAAKMFDLPKDGNTSIINSGDGFNTGTGDVLNFEPMIVSSAHTIVSTDLNSLGVTGEDDATEHSNGPGEQRLPKAELLRRMLLRLQEITNGMEWQAVTPDKQGRLVPTSIPSNLSSTEGLSFRTSGNVKDPDAAKEQLREFFSAPKDRSHASAIRKAAQVDFPASWVRPIHLTWEPRSSFTKAFVPSDFQARPGKDDKMGLG